MAIEGCYVQASSTGYQTNTKYQLRKAANSNPFSEFSILENVSVFDMLQNVILNMIVIDTSREVESGIWALGLAQAGSLGSYGDSYESSYWTIIDNSLRVSSGTCGYHDISTEAVGDYSMCLIAESDETDFVLARNSYETVVTHDIYWDLTCDGDYSSFYTQEYFMLPWAENISGSPNGGDTDADADFSGLSGYCKYAGISNPDYLYDQISDYSSIVVASSSTSADYTVPTPQFKEGLHHISILEKINRLLELHDPDLIDIKYIQYLANYLGYKLTLDRDDLGVVLAANEGSWSTMTDEEQEELENKQLRFMVRNLPTWYKMKTTTNALNMLMYSFGLIADIQNYYTTNYSSETFRVSGVSDQTVDDNYYITPHFTVFTDLDQSLANFTIDSDKLESIIKAINSIRPINTVFRGITGWLRRNFITYSGMVATNNLYIQIPYTQTGTSVITGGFVS